MKDSESPSSSKGPLTTKSFVENDITHEASVGSGTDEAAPTPSKRERGASIKHSGAGGQSATSILTNLRNADAVEDQDSVVDHRSLRQVAAGEPQPQPMKAGKKGKARTGADRSHTNTKSPKVSDDYSTSNADNGKRDEMTKTMYKGSQKLKTGRETPTDEQEVEAASKAKRKHRKANHIKVRDHEDGKRDDKL